MNAAHLCARPSRGGTNMCRSGGYLYRMNGFDGEMEQAGVINVFEVKVDSWSSRIFLAHRVSGPQV